MNLGSFTKEAYIKKVSFSKAVLWKDRQLSLPKEIINKIIATGIRKIIFIDEVKGEQWEFKSEKVFRDMTLKIVGQEPQYYFSILLAKKVKIEKPAKPEYVFDPVRNVYVVKQPTPEPVKTETVQGALF